MSKKKRVLKIFSKKNSKKIYVLLFVLLFAVIGVYTLVMTNADAGPGTMSLTPTSASVNLGATTTVTIMAESGSVPVNAVQADLTYDATKLDFVSVDTTGSAYGLAVQATGGNGKVSIVRAINVNSTTGNLTPLTGNNKVASVTFKAKAAGASNVQVASTSLLLSHIDSDTLTLTRTGSTVTVKDTVAPNVPSGLTSASQTVSSVNLSWAAPKDTDTTTNQDTDVTGYNIYRNGTKIGQSPTTTYTSTGLSPSTAYSFTVSAYDAAGNESSKTAALSTTTKPDTEAPSAPLAPTLSSRTHTSLSVSWPATNDNVKTTGYAIYRNNERIGTTTSTSYVATGLKPGTTYEIYVIAYDAVNNESKKDLTKVARLTTLVDTEKPNPGPTSLISPLQAGTSISLSWTSAKDNVAIAGYTIYRNGVKVGTTTATTYNNSGLTPGTSYSFAVSAYDSSNNESVKSNVVNVAIPLKTGDLNNDTKVDTLDLSKLLTNFGKKSAVLTDGDLNKNTEVDIYDLSMLLANWKK